MFQEISIDIATECQQRKKTTTQQQFTDLIHFTRSPLMRIICMLASLLVIKFIELIIFFITFNFSNFLQLQKYKIEVEAKYYEYIIIGLKLHIFFLFFNATAVSVYAKYGGIELIARNIDIESERV